MSIAKAYECYLSAIREGATKQDAINEAVFTYSHEGITESNLLKYIAIWG